MGLKDCGFCIPPIVTDVLNTFIGADKKQFNIFNIDPDKLNVHVDVEKDAVISTIDPTNGTTAEGNYI